MRELRNDSSLKVYRITITMTIALMITGLFVVYFRKTNVDLDFIIHLILVVLLSVQFIIYPKNENVITRILIIVTTFLYFYTLFIIYPETPSTFILICLIPSIAILFFHLRLFYFALVANTFLMMLTFGYVLLVDQGERYLFIYNDITGNIINFIGSQIILYFVFKLSHSRIESQKKYYEQIQQAERLKTTGQLAAAVAHEIRNPITVVKGFLQFYQSDNTVPEHVKKHYPLMMEELQIAETVINDFLTLAKPAEEISVTVEVKAALHSVYDLLSSYALMNNIQFSVVIDEEYTVKCSLMEFKQLFVNLIKNAIEATPSGGSIEITAKRKGNKLAIYVKDNGDGMTKEEVKALGTPFYTLKSKGTGLGLMICYNIMEKYHGSILFNSEKGKGTKVGVTFPIM
ncbi:HAMP domain-containing sensor histidine kinase [Cytobacillus sp. S13-E01]|uniref:sensor histidine kinase n=1 Tax=Cytobacillus sp. S13-E01 TaxID=3031326 RepID=UPI0023D8883B|nr:HAMP domain-containing sensor histidine kinase [Cytobacillus sp. S13-E01]MDF0727031.1 HAMP domain-containing sensor histidine kinase [Cytobacillus sp. S13-E01]